MLALSSLSFLLAAAPMNTNEGKTNVESPSAPALNPSVLGVPAEADKSEEADVEAVDVDPLEYSQKERQALFKGGLAFNIGPVMPWSDYGMSLFWNKAQVIQSVSLGAGDFEFSDNYKERNYLVKVDSQSAYYAARWFVLGFGPLYLEPFAGVARWTGSIRPRGFDDVADELASSLNSRFDMTGVSIGGNIGLMWIFSNGFFVDYNLFGINASTFIQKSFTTNSDEAKKNVKRQLGGPLTMSNLQLRLGWSMDI